MAFSIQRGLVVLAATAGLALLLNAGCQNTAQGPAASAPALASKASQKGGAELWAETCSHCHNLRSPSSYGPYQWEVAVYDMRVRAHLTGEEQRKITAFLKAASQ